MVSGSESFDANAANVSGNMSMNSDTGGTRKKDGMLTEFPRYMKQK